MHKNILQSIDNVAIWPVISFVIFLLFFLVLLWYVITVDKSFIRYMKDLPSHDGTDTKTSNKNETPHL